MENKTVKDSLLEIRMSLLDCTRSAQTSEVRELLYCTAFFLCEAMLSACGDKARSTSEIAVELVKGRDGREEIIRAMEDGNDLSAPSSFWDDLSRN
jgi:hypothetical protein